MGEATVDTWNRINSNDELTLDGTYIIVAESTNVALGNAASSSYMANTGVTIENSKISTLPADAMIITLSETATAGQYLLNCTNPAAETNEPCYLYSATGSKNYLKAGNNTTLSPATISINANTGDAKITFVKCTNSEGTARSIRCNTSNNNVFGAYATTNGAPVQIYKLTAGTPAVEYTTQEFLESFETENARFKVAYDDSNKEFTFTSSDPKITFEHFTKLDSEMPKFEAVSRAAENDIEKDWQPLENGVFNHSAITKDTHFWVHAVKGTGENKIASPEFWRLLFANGQTTGIEDVAAEAEEAAELYNLQGVRVDRATAAPGLYIERRGSKTAKVIL